MTQSRSTRRGCESRVAGAPCAGGRRSRASRCTSTTITRPATCAGCSASAATLRSATSTTTSTASMPRSPTSPRSDESLSSVRSGDRPATCARRRICVRCDHRRPARLLRARVGHPGMRRCGAVRARLRRKRRRRHDHRLPHRRASVSGLLPRSPGWRSSARSGVVASAPPSSIGSPPTRLRQALASCS